MKEGFPIQARAFQERFQPLDPGRLLAVDVEFKIAIGLSEAVSLACLVSLWRGDGRAIAKLLWSLFVLVPLLGPIGFAVWHDPPPPSDPLDRPPPIQPEAP
jgi:hypothetical protein